MKPALDLYSNREVQSRPARGAWIETERKLHEMVERRKSRPARGAWIETPTRRHLELEMQSRPARGAWIETIASSTVLAWQCVAPRTGRVD